MRFVSFHRRREVVVGKLGRRFHHVGLRDAFRTLCRATAAVAANANFVAKWQARAAEAQARATLAEATLATLQDGLALTPFEGRLREGKGRAVTPRGSWWL